MTIIGLSDPTTVAPDIEKTIYNKTRLFPSNCGTKDTDITLGLTNATTPIRGAEGRLTSAVVVEVNDVTVVIIV